MSTENVAISSEMIPIIYEYAKAVREKDRIPILDKLWDIAIKNDPGVRQHWSKQNWLVAAIHQQMADAAPPGGLHIFRDRESLRHAPDMLWQKVEQGLTMTSAVTILRESRELAGKKKIPIDDAILQIVQTYEKGNKRHTPDGKFFYVKSTIVGAIVGNSAGKKDHPREAGAEDTERQLWNDIRKRIGMLVALKMGDDIDPAMLEEFTAEFEGEFQNLRKALTMRLKTRSITVKVEYNRVQYIAACRKLHIDPSEIGKPIDVQAAKSAKKKLLRAYHPDANGGDKALQHLCEEIVKAFDVIEAYASQMQRSDRSNKKQSDNKKGDPDAS